MRFIVQGKLPSLNEYTSANRTNVYLGNNMKKKTENSIIFAIRQANLPKVDKYPIKLKITWYEPNKRRDLDNIVFATKFIQDALVKAGILENDSQRYIVCLEHTVKIDRENPRVEVIIEKTEIGK